MYSNTSSCVNVNNKLTDWFVTEKGCRQGDVTSPTAFSIIINDLLKELTSSGIGVKINDNLVVSVLAFADDIVLLTENAKDLQKLITIVRKWSFKWRFIINPEKSQVVHYRNAPKVRTNFEFRLHDNGPILKVVDSYKYLGVYLDEYLTFTQTTSVLASAGGRALGSMINRFKKMSDMGHSTYTKLYHSLLTPVTDYGSAIWGFKGYNDLDKVQNRASRFFTGVHKFAPTVGYTGDMGWISNRGRWKINTLRLWNRLVALDDNRLTKKIFIWDRNEHNLANKSNFCAQVKQILCDIKQKDSYRKLEAVDINYSEQQVRDGEISKWSNAVTKFSKLDLLAEIKPTFGTEEYLKMDLDRYDKSLLSQFRYGILPIEIETGRYKNLERKDRKCTLCNTGEIEDQLHFALKCPIFNQYRSAFVDKCRDRIVGRDILTDTGKISALFNEQARLFGKYLRKTFLHRKTLIYK